MKTNKLFESLSRHFIAVPVWRVWLDMIGGAIVFSVAVIATMDWMLLGRITTDHLLIGLIASILAASLGSGLVLFTIEQIRLINEHKIKQALQKESLSLVENTLQATDNGILVINQSGKIILANRRFIEMWRIPGKMLSARSVEKLFASVLDQLTNPRQFIDKINELNRQPEASARDILHFTDGRVFARYSNPQTLGKQIVGRVWSFLEITEQHHAQQRVLQLSMSLRSELKRSERQREQLQSLLSAIPDMVWMKDPKGVFLSCNPATGLLLGAEPSEIIGKTDFDFFPPDVVKRLHRADHDAAASDQPIRHEEWITYNSDGHSGLLDTIKTAVRGKDGKLIGVLGIARDITKIRVLMKELEKARGEAMESSEAKSRFLANMSHDIRTPMNAVLGFCYLLEQRKLDNESRDLVSKIHNAGHSLLGLINDILDFSKIEAGRMEIEAQPFLLCDLLNDLAAIMTASAGDKPLELIITPPREACALIGDTLRLQQVLVNLLGNAIKFTERGEVELKAELESSDADQVTIRFAVRDTGIGISSEQQAEIFSAFSQADNTISRRYGGTGLGLAISEQLVSLMGGALRVKSAPGQGSEFRFILSLPRDPSVEPPPSGPSGLHLLVADDCASTRNALRQAIQSEGWNADYSGSGKAALKAVQTRLARGESYDAVLLDWKMPGLDGLDAARAIRETFSAEPLPKDRTPPVVIIMATAQSRATLLAHPGMANAVLCKPITPRALRNAIAAAAQQEARPPAEEMENRPMRVSGIRVLVVDDSEINRELARRILEGEGATVHLASDGYEALDWLHTHPDSVDLALMDVQMPGLDGYVTTRRIREEGRWKDLPIIAITAGAFQSLRDAAKEAGMDDFIAKPFNVDQMMASIQHWTGRRPMPPAASQGQSSPSGNAPAPQRQESGTGSSLELLPDIDWEGGFKRWGDQGAYLTYLAKFSDEYAETGRVIATLCEGSDLAAAAGAAHRIKGTAASLALIRTTELARRLELRLLAGEPAPELISELDSAIKHARSLISREAGLRNRPAAAKPAAGNHDRKELLSLLTGLTSALDHNDLDLAEAHLGKLGELLAHDHLDRIRGRLADFDFRGAEALARDLIDELNLSETD